MGVTRREVLAVGAAAAVVGVPRRDPFRADALAVRQRVSAAWEAYEAHAFGQDELRPLSQTGSAFFAPGTTVGLTLVEALDTFVLMGLWDAAAKATTWIRDHFDPAQDVLVSTFETTIRLLGGLISAHGATGDPLFLDRARQLGDRLLAAFATPTGIPAGQVNLRTGARAEPVVGAANAVTHIAELARLTQLTGDQKYLAASMKAVLATVAALSPLGLPGTFIDTTTGRWTATESTINPPGDSFLESLLDGWLVTRDPALRAAYDAATRATLLRQLQPSGWMFSADALTGVLTRPDQNALAAYYPGLLAQSGDLRHARRLWQAWEDERRRRGGLLALWFNPQTDAIIDPGAAVRPEHVDACLHLWLHTKDDRFRRAAASAMRAEARACGQVPTVLTDVTTGARGDLLPAYWWSEQTKYAWLMFHRTTRVNLKSLVLNTEGHVLTGWR